MESQAQEHTCDAPPMERWEVERRESPEFPWAADLAYTVEKQVEGEDKTQGCLLTLHVHCGTGLGRITDKRKINALKKQTKTKTKNPKSGMTEMACVCGRDGLLTWLLCVSEQCPGCWAEEGKGDRWNCLDHITPKPETPGPAGLVHKV